MYIAIGGPHVSFLSKSVGGLCMFTSGDDSNKLFCDNKMRQS